MTTPANLSPDIHNAMLFRLLFGTQDDRYEPETAVPLFRALVGLDDDSARVSIALWAGEARIKCEGQVN